MFQVLSEHYYQPRLYPAKLSITVEREVKAFQNKDKLREIMTIRTQLQKMLTGILYPEEKEFSKQYN